MSFWTIIWFMLTQSGWFRSNVEHPTGWLTALRCLVTLGIISSMWSKNSYIKKKIIEKPVTIPKVDDHWKMMILQLPCEIPHLNRVKHPQAPAHIAEMTFSHFEVYHRRRLLGNNETMKTAIVIYCNFFIKLIKIAHTSFWCVI